MAPSRRPEIARSGLKAVFAATLANLSSACLGGIFFFLYPPDKLAYFEKS